MAVQIASKSWSGSGVTVKVVNSDPAPRTVMVSLRVSVDGQPVDLTSSWTTIPAGTSGTVFLQAPGPVEFIADSPDPTVLIQSQ